MREYPNWVQFLGRLMLGALLAAPLLWFGWFVYGRAGMLLAVLFVMPLVVKLVARQMIELAHEGLSWLWHQPLEAWHGSYYAFDDVHVRVYEVDAGLWFVVDDILKATGIRRLPAQFLATHAAELQRVPGTRLRALTLPAVEALLASHRDARAGRFILWARREVVAPWERRRGIDKPRFEAKVR